MLSLLSVLARGRVALLGAALALLAGCDNECSFDERCNGNVRETCGEGADQMFGRRIARSPCTAPNDVCVDRNGAAECVAPALTECEPSTDPRCHGDTVVSCGATGFERLAVCDEAYSVCRESQFKDQRWAACLYDPEIPCGNGSSSRCEGTIRLECSLAFGRFVASDCAAEMSDPAAVCVTSESGSSYSYCTTTPAD
ncbi:MAG: hypothetical protein EOO75_08810 [Myxococcales bacterium]|nr:MAG: hypothetical protein EOO75_08810 [Myxococcales bacterium]